MSKLVVCLTGMPGAGKSTITEGLKSKGLFTLNMGDMVRKEAKKQNLEPTRQNLGKLMLELREKNGPGAVAELVKYEIENSESKIIIIDGIRSNSEVQILKNAGTVKLLAVHASSNTRYNFLNKRGRSDDPENKQHFEERDERELKVGISDSIALADESISNNQLTKEELINSAYTIIQNWLRSNESS